MPRLRIERANTGIVEWGYLVDDETGRTVAQGDLAMLARVKAEREEKRDEHRTTQEGP